MHRDRNFLAPLWSALAEFFAGRAFEPGFPDLHASFAWALAGRWDAVRAAVEAERHWRGEPSLLLAHAEACWHRGATWRPRVRIGCGCAGSIPWRPSGPLPRPSSPTAVSPSFRTDAATWTRHWIPKISPAWLLLQEPATAISLAPDSITRHRLSAVVPPGHR